MYGLDCRKELHRRQEHMLRLNLHQWTRIRGCRTGVEWERDTGVVTLIKRNTTTGMLTSNFSTQEPLLSSRLRSRRLTSWEHKHGDRVEQDWDKATFISVPPLAPHGAINYLLQSCQMCVATASDSWSLIIIIIFFSSSLLPHAWELAPSLEHRAKFPQFLIQGQSAGFHGRGISSSQERNLHYQNYEENIANVPFLLEIFLTK
jgi:hypothetical protein